MASNDAMVLEGKWMVWGQFLDPYVNQDTVRKLFSTAFLLVSQKHGGSSVKSYDTNFIRY